jgi:uncharacterized membrane protein
MTEPTPSTPTTPTSEPTPAPIPTNPPAGLSDNAAGAIAYITFIPAIVFLLVEPYNKNAYIRFHAWQSIFLSAAAIATQMVFGFALAVFIFFAPLLYTIPMHLIQLAFFVIWIIVLVNASQGKRFKLPVIGDLAEKQANK